MVQRRCCLAPLWSAMQKDSDEYHSQRDETEGFLARENRVAFNEKFRLFHNAIFYRNVRIPS